MGSRFGFTDEYYAQKTGMWHLRARDLHPAIGHFLSADPVQPCPEGSQPGTQGYNRYAYAANNPTTWVDPSGYSVEPGAGDDLSLLLLLNVMGTGLANYLECFLDERCKALQLVMNDLGSQGANLVVWSAEALEQALFSTYPHEPTPVSPADLVFSLALSNTPIWGDLYDLTTAVTGYDFVTGQYLAGWERLATLVGVIPIPGISGGNLRHGVDAVDSFASHGDDLARYIGKTCSFDEETPVTTDEGSIPIKDVDVGDRVLAWDEATGSTGYFLVTTTYTDVHELLVYLTIDGERVETTPEHPFLTADGTWVTAGALAVGDALRSADGALGVVDAIEFVVAPQTMYNLTVADAHTYVVGDGEWVVHNACQFPARKILFSQEFFSTSGKIDAETRYLVTGNAQWLYDNPGLELPGGPMGIFLKQPFMDEWGPMVHPTKGYVGDPRNLATGFIYTLNNRRLATYILAGRETVPIHWASFDEIMDLRYQFDTPNFGITIQPRVR